MSRTITVSSPGKLMLFGEHAVVYGKPCIVTTVNQRLSIKVSSLKEPLFQLNAPDVDINNYSKPISDLGKGEIPKGAKFVEMATRNFLSFRAKVSATSKKQVPLGQNLFKTKQIATSSASWRTPRNDTSGGVKFETVTQFKSTFGFGSSSASAVCTVKALSELFELDLTEKEIFDLSYKTVIDVQGLGSGFDLAAAIYGGTLYFVTGGQTTQPLTINHLPLIVGYTGVKADTATIVREVKARFEQRQEELEKIYNNIEKIVEKAKTALLKEDFQTLGELMNLNQIELKKLGVSSEKLDSLIKAARNAGAYGAKLSGAGRGDCMIALAPDAKRKAVEDAIEKAGGQDIKVDVNTKGAIIE